MSNCEYTGKVRYMKSEATEAAKRSNARHAGKGGGQITVEKCKHCGDWHLFHPARPIKATKPKQRPPRYLTRMQGEDD